MLRIILLLACFFLAPAYSYAEINEIDVTGSDLNLVEAPSKIVSLNPSATEILFFLGMESELMGITDYCAFNAPLSKKEKIGSVLNPDIERIIALSPDLVFATIDGNRKESVLLLKNAGIKVFVLPKVNSFKELYDEIRQISRIVKKEKAAKELITSMKIRLGIIKTRIRKMPKVKVFLQMNTQPLITTNKETILNKMLELAGGVNIARRMRIPYPVITREAVIEADPDVIIVVSMGGATLDILEEWGKYQYLKAVRNDRIYVIPAEYMCNIGPRIVKGVEILAGCFYPDLFSQDGNE